MEESAYTAVATKAVFIFNMAASSLLKHSKNMSLYKIQGMEQLMLFKTIFSQQHSFMV